MTLSTFFILILCYRISSLSIKEDPINEFSDHQRIKLRIHQELLSRSHKNVRCSDIFKLQFKAFDNYFILNLIVNEELTGIPFGRESDCNNNKKLTFEGICCHFSCHLSSSNLHKSWCAISVYSDGVNGVISDGNELYYIHYNNTVSQHYIFRHKDMLTSAVCGVKNFIDTRNEIGNRYRRSLTEMNPDLSKSNSNSRFIELVLVNDYKVFTDSNRSKNLVIEKTKQIANVINALYNQLNIWISLVEIIIWSEKDEITLSNDGDVTLVNFLHYRKSLKMENDNAQLITGTSFNGGVIGKALKGSMCSFENSGGINSDHSHIVGLVAVTVAHEIGHNFGMDHDNSNCTCPEDKCIMSASTSSSVPIHWSSCSQKQIEHAFEHGMDHCLKNRPKMIVGPVCGNGFLEKGEQCDCGLTENCNNRCCIAETCKFAVKNAECSTGSCCDLSTCKPIPTSTNRICRPAKGSCDFPEFCDGTSQFCPSNIYVHDGTQCTTKDQNIAYCYNGECKAHEDQCKLLWGATGKKSHSLCYKNNVVANKSGNCGFDRINDKYIRCNLEDVECGLLYCTHLNEKLEYGIESAAKMASPYYTTEGKIITCRSVLVDFGINDIDPGLVPNGARCGGHHMCLDQKCTSLKKVFPSTTCPDGCNSNGLCDNLGFCHCFEGFSSDNCAAGYSNIILIIVVFLCLISIICSIACFHGRIKTWYFIKKRRASIKARAKSNQDRHQQFPRLDFRSIDISDPVPIEEYPQSAQDNYVGGLRSTNIRKHQNTYKNVSISAPLTSHDNMRLKIKPNTTETNNQATNVASSNLPLKNSQQATIKIENKSSANIRRYNTVQRPKNPPPRPPLPTNY